MRLFGTFLPSDASLNPSGYKKGSSDGIYGAGVATQQFMANLLRYGDFDEYHFLIQLAIHPQSPVRLKPFLGSVNPIRA